MEIIEVGNNGRPRVVRLNAEETAAHFRCDYLLGIGHGFDRVIPIVRHEFPLVSEAFLSWLAN